MADALEGLLAPVHEEDGVLQYEMYRDMQEPRCFVFIERWESLELSTRIAYRRMSRLTRTKTEGWVESNKIHVLKKGK